MDSQVWLNGKLLGSRPYGYSSFYFDLGPAAHFGPEKNILSVRLNVQQPCSRWYSGAGLYRHVWLITTGQVHVAQWGAYITTPQASATGAKVRVQTQIRNDGASAGSAVLTTRLLDPAGHEAGRLETAQPLAPHAGAAFDQTISLPAPQLWSLEAPVLYRAVSEVRVGGELVDSMETPFGIRTIAFTTDKGFFLNGRHIRIQGVCDHHDLGCLGSVALRRGFERQLQILKTMGCNALRTSHNPPSPELLDLCDRMGILVMDEALDEWQHSKTKLGYGRFFDQWSDRDVAAMVDRDRNHPSIILWSIGNEIPEGGSPVPGSTEAMSRRLVDDCHREDPTRPVTSAGNRPDKAWVNGLARPLGVFGINYHTDFYQFNDPGLVQTGTDPRAGGYKGTLPMIASETASGTSTRGEYGLSLDAQGNLQVNADVPFRTPEYGNYPPRVALRSEHALIALQKAPWVAGAFVWTGFDYLGEPSYDWPARSSDYGIFDLCGFPKDRFYLYKAQWSAEPVVHIMPHWTWPGFEGKPIPVWVFTNADSVELFLNGKSLGSRNYPANTDGASLHLAWTVPYAPGELKAVATKAGQIVASDDVRTTGAPASITLAPDRTRLESNGQDLSFVKVAVVDKDGLVCPGAGNEITFSLAGSAAVLAGLDNGDTNNHEAFHGTRHQAFHGLGLAVLKSRYDLTGPVTLTASAPGLSPARITIQVGTR